MKASKCNRSWFQAMDSEELHERIELARDFCRNARLFFFVRAPIEIAMMRAELKRRSV